MATLVVVMVLFFILSMVAAYTSRNLIFEQRTSANQYRSTQALEAAEAGVEWTLAMLNGGRIDEDCLPSTDVAATTFRERYFQPIAADGTLTLRTRTGGGALMPACVFDAATTAWRCRCPVDAEAAVPTLSGTAAMPMFRIRFEFVPLPPTGTGRRDVVRIVAAGCTRPDAACLAETPSAPGGDALSVVNTLIALKSGLTTPPGAPVTARGNLDAGTGTLTVTNTDPATEGVTLVAGGTITGNPTLTSLPGTPGGESTVEADPQLSGLVDVGAFPAADRMFAHLFAMTPAMYEQQPAAVIVDCSTACAAADINALVATNRGRMLWLNGALTVDGNIGTAANPALVVVTGNVTLTSGTVFGLIYSRAADWDRGAGTTVVNGAIVAESALSGDGSQTINYDAALLNQLRTRVGSFVRVPGGWRDFE